MTDSYTLQAESWSVVNDDVMGGISQSQVANTQSDTWLFSGNVSLENNGGFASARTMTDTIDISPYTTARLELKGDGNRYGFNLRSQNMRRLSYRAYFTTTGDWQTIEIPLDDLQPTSFGETVPEAPPLDRTQVEMVGFIIADAQEGAFALEIRSIQFV